MKWINMAKTTVLDARCRRCVGSSAAKRKVLLGFACSVVSGSVEGAVGGCANGATMVVDALIV